MARGTLPVQEVDPQDGLTDLVFTNADAVDGHLFSQKHGDVWVMVKTGATTTIVTAPITTTVQGVTPAGKTFSIGANKFCLIPPLPLSDYGQASDNVWLNLSAATNVSLAAFRRKLSR